MRGLNQVNLIGNLGTAPTVRSMDNGDLVATLSLATNFTYKKANGDRVTTTEWHRIIAWRGLAEIAEKYLHKGSKLYIGGRIHYQKWEDKDGVTRYTTEIVANELTLLDSVPKTAAEALFIDNENENSNAPDPVDQDSPKADY